MREKRKRDKRNITKLSEGKGRTIQLKGMSGYEKIFRKLWNI